MATKYERFFFSVDFTQPDGYEAIVYDVEPVRGAILPTLPPAAPPAAAAAATGAPTILPPPAAPPSTTPAKPTILPPPAAAGAPTPPAAAGAPPSTIPAKPAAGAPPSTTPAKPAAGAPPSTTPITPLTLTALSTRYGGIKQINTSYTKAEANAIAQQLVSHKIGFENAGNQCYKSAALQMLTHMPEFVSAILQLESYVVPIPALKTLIVELNKSPRTFQPETCDIAFDEDYLTDRLGCIADVGIQEDAAQFIDQCIFQKLIDYYESIYKTPTNKDKPILKLFLEQCATIVNASYYDSDSCLNKNKVGNTRDEELYMYSAPINGIDISDILSKNICEPLEIDYEPQRDPKGNPIKDPATHRIRYTKTKVRLPDGTPKPPLKDYPTASHKSYKIKSSGLYFIMSLKRFDGALKKIRDPVPINNEIIIGSTSIQYTLQGIIVHSGSSIAGGHYVYYWRESATEWQVISDSSVSTCTSTLNIVRHIVISIKSSGYDINKDGFIFLYKQNNTPTTYVNIDTIIDSRKAASSPTPASASAAAASSPTPASAAAAAAAATLTLADMNGVNMVSGTKFNQLYMDNTIIPKLTAAKAILPMNWQIDATKYNKIYVTSDIHADFSRFVTMLKLAKLINTDVDVYDTSPTGYDNINKLIAEIEWMGGSEVLLVIVGDLVDGERDGVLNGLIVPAGNLNEKDPRGSFEFLLHAFIYNLRLSALSKNSDVRFTLGNHDYHTIILTDPQLMNYVHGNAINYFGNFGDRSKALTPFYTIMPFYYLSVANATSSQVEFVHAGLHESTTDYTQQLSEFQEAIFTGKFKTGTTNPTQLQDFSINPIGSNGPLWVREHAMSVSGTCPQKPDKHKLIVVGHCITNDTNSFTRFASLNNKPAYAGCGSAKHCVYTDCGGSLAFVDVASSRAMITPKEKPVEMLYLEHIKDKDLVPYDFNDGRYYNRMKRIILDPANTTTAPLKIDFQKDPTVQIGGGRFYKTRKQSMRTRSYKKRR